MPSRRTICTSCILGAVASFSAGPSANAAAQVWKNTGSDFGTAANWTSAAPAAGDVAQFSAVESVQPILGGNVAYSIAGFNFSATTSSNYDITRSGTGTFTLTGYDTTGGGSPTGNSAAVAIRGSNISGTNTIEVPLTLAPASGTVSTFYQVAGGTLVVTGSISGGGSLSLNGGGTIQLSGSNSYLGNTTILGATTVKASSIGDSGSAGNLGAGTAINIGTTTSAGTLVYTGTGETTTKTLNLNGSTGGATIDQSGTGSLKFSSDVTTTAGIKTLTLQGSTAGTGEISGKIADSSSGATSLTKLGTGTWTLTGANTYTGTTTVTGGTLAVSGGSAIADTGAVSIGNNTGGTFQLGANETIGSITGGGSTSGTIALGANSLTLSNQAGTYSGAITGSSGSKLIKSGSGTLTLNRTSAYGSNFTLRINAGTVDLNNGSTLVGVLDSSNVVELNGGVLQITASSGGNMALTLGGLDVYSNSSLAFNRTGANSSNSPAETMPFNFRGDSILTLTFGGAITGGTTTFNAAANTPANTLYANGGLNFDSTNSTAVVIANSINESGGSYSFTKQGTGTLTLSAANAFSGGMILSAGKLNINNASALGTGAFSIAAGTTIDNTSGSLITLSTNNSQNWNGDFTFTGSNDLNLGTGAVTLNANRQVTVAGGNLTVGGAIGGGAVSLTKLGAGTLTLGGANTYTGGTAISAGTVALGSSGALGTTGTISFGGGLLQYSASNTTDYSARFSSAASQAYKIDTNGQNVTFASALTSSGGTLAKSGAGVLTLSGANSYTGVTTISTGGALNIQNATGLGTTAAGTTVAAGAALQLQGGITVGAEALSLNGAGVSTDGALRNISGNNTYGGAITLAATGVRINSDSGTLTLNSATAITGTGFALTVGGSGNTTIASAINTGTSGTLSKDGSGTLTLSGANNYTGAVSIGAGGALNIQNGTGLGTTAGGVTVAAGASLQLQNSITVGAEALSLSGTGVSTEGALRNISGTNTYGGVVTLAAASRINSDAGSLTLSASNSITGATQNLTLGGAGNGFVNGTITTTSGTVTKDGIGNWTLSGSNTYTGITTVSQGTLTAASANALGAAASQNYVDIQNGGTLALSGGITLSGAGNIYLAGPGATGKATLYNASGDNSTARLLNLDATNGVTSVGSASGTLSLSGTIVDYKGASELQITGSGIVALSAASTYAGGTRVSGTLALGASDTVTSGLVASGPIGVGTLFLGNGSTLRSTSTTARTLENSLSLSGGTTLGDGATTGSLSFDSTGLTNPATIAFTANTSATVLSTVNFNNVVSGNFALTKLGGGTLNLGGSVANIYSGLTTVSGGALVLNKATAGLNAIAGDLTINGGSVSYGTSNNEQIADTSSVTLSSGSFDLGARIETISSLAMSGGSLSVGSGSLILSSASSATGGTVTLTTASSRITASAGLSLGGATFNYTNASDNTANGLLLGGDVTYAASNTAAAIFSNTLAGVGRVNLQGVTRTFDIADSTTLPAQTPEVQIGWSVQNGGLTKIGTGTMLLTAANTYTGTTTVSNGTLATGATGSIASSTSIVVNGTGTLLLGNSSNQIKDDATVNLAGGTLKISDAVAGINENLGALSLTVSSIIDFGLGGTDAAKNLLTFSSINLDQLANFTLSIYNWSGNGTIGGGADQLYFSAYTGTFSQTNLNNIKFYSDAGTNQVGDGGTYQTNILGSFEYVPVPEPSTWIGGGLILGLAAFSQRKRMKIMTKS